MAQQYPVNEIFLTLQGEGQWQGVPATFVRLQGCDVGCPWCDTKHTWAIDPAVQLPALPRGSRDGARSWALMTPDAIAGHVAAARAQHQSQARLIVLTGGEPAMHPLAELAERLLLVGYQVQLETSGTYPLTDLPAAVWVTLSPKIGMPGGRGVLPQVLERADEVKHPVGKPRDLDQLLELLNGRFPEMPAARVSLQPVSQSEKATQLCVKACLSHGFRLSVQLHKIVNIP